MFVSETYSVEDCLDYDLMTSNSGKWNIPSAMQSAISYNSNGMTVSGLSSGQSMTLKTSYNVPVAVEFDLIASSSSGNYDNASPQLCIDGTLHNHNSITIKPKSLIIQTGNNSGSFTDHSVSSVLGTYKIVMQSTQYSVYLDGTLVATQSNASISSTNFLILSSSNRSFTMKNVKIKPVS